MSASSTLASSPRLCGPASSQAYFGRGSQRQKDFGASRRLQQAATKSAGHRSHDASSIQRVECSARPGESSVGLPAESCSPSSVAGGDRRSWACAGSSIVSWY